MSKLAQLKEITTIVADTGDIDAIKKASEELSTEMQKIGEVMQKAAQETKTGADTGDPASKETKDASEDTSGEGKVRDAEYEEKKPNDDIPKDKK